MKLDTIWGNSNTLGAGYCWTTLVWFLFHHAVFAHRFDEGADFEVTHEHLVVAGAVQAGLVCPDLLSLFVPLVLVVTS